MSDIKEILSDFADAMLAVHNPDRLFEFIHDQGVEFKGSPLPKLIDIGTKKQCFNNAADLAIEHSGLLYVEGYAIQNKVGFPIHHAWVVDRDNNVIDNTWQAPQDCTYYGVPVEREMLIERLLETGVYGVLLNERGTLDLDYVARCFNWTPPDNSAIKLEKPTISLTI